MTTTALNLSTAYINAYNLELKADLTAALAQESETKRARRKKKG
jgi:hypothetical protein